jgi:branched-chain amino acid transport system ATP-binding protein
MNDSSLALQTRGLTKSFGGLSIFRDVNFALAARERHAVIGPNGAGKSTFVHLVSGMLTPTSGSVHLMGRDVTASTPQERVKAGLGRTFQINTLFPNLTPLESVVLALCERDDLTMPSLRALARQTSLVDEAALLLDRFGLSTDALHPTGSMPYGKQRVLEMALALAQKPRVLLLDEPAAGLTTAQGHALFELLGGLAGDTSVLFIEHDMALVFGYAQRVTVLCNGSLLAQGTPDEIRGNELVRKAYLGH